MLVLVVLTTFFLLYGLVPLFGGAQLGLVGADEPRYAQIAREMLATHNRECDALHAEIVPRNLTPTAINASYHCLLAGTVTPILYGQPWLEKPALYYWRAMGFFREFGVADWSARLPSATGAGFLIILIFLHMRRFRPGGHLDAALITASCAGIIGFSRGASTDMQLAAPFCIGMLGWYAWYETGKKFWLFDLYFFVGAATLAKGPVAPFMAGAIIFLFIALRREWSLLRRTIWLPGIALFFAMVLPWYIAVQRKNPTFVREFFLEHNLERFGTNRYMHHQPRYYYLVVLVLALMPWTVFAIRALVDALQISITEWKVRSHPQRYLGYQRAGDAFPEFLVLWAIFPIVFFSFSGSKLPGYILPSLPPITILTGDYLYRIRERGMPRWLLWAHACTVGFITFVILLCPTYMVVERIWLPTRAVLLAAIIAGLFVAGMLVTVAKGGAGKVRMATCIAVAASILFLMSNVHFQVFGHRFALQNGPLLDENYSARPLARMLTKDAPDVHTVAVYNVRRDMEYGLAFYLNRPMVNYELSGIPPQEHILVVRTAEVSSLDQVLMGRARKQMFVYPWQGLTVYRVAAQ
ncbi:MAG: glycosyltransferase family 39 protein [Acidobacteriaceae bacterium]|jgi:4-amino-4-deoxy-L-arabinose transferase-like glycosyltransferase|nr:glycosyltransferase family 39 protein [Acidobacteriaceae bacterium]